MAPYSLVVVRDAAKLFFKEGKVLRCISEKVGKNSTREFSRKRNKAKQESLMLTNARNKHQLRHRKVTSLN